MRPKPSTVIRVLVVDDHYIVRHELVDAIRNEPDLLVVGEATDGDEAVELFRRHRPDITLMDLRMPRMSGQEAMSAILRDFPASRIIVLTAHHADDDVMKAVAAGACSYLIKGTPKEALVDAIRAVYRGEQRLSPQIAGHFAERVEVPTLNLLDQMVLRLIALGRSSGEIAEKLGLDASKAKGHVSGVIEKLGARDRKEAIMRAMQRGLLPSNVRDR